MGPIVGILVHLTQMDRRYYIVEGYGPMQSTYWNAWGTFWMAFMPIIIAIGALIFTGKFAEKTWVRLLAHEYDIPAVMALVNIYLRRAKMLTMISSDSRTSKDQFVRLYVLSVAELATCL
jgi:pheromone a factor receptor